MRLLPTSDQIMDDLNDLKLRIAKMNARRNAQINLLQRKTMGGSLRSKYYPWSREYYRRLYNAYPHLYPLGAYPWRSSSLDSLELDKYYDSLDLDDKLYAYDRDDPLYSKYKRSRINAPSTDLLSKLKDFVFEQERQMTTDLLRKITEDRKLRSTDTPNLYGRESKSLSRYDTPVKNDPPFLNPINKKDNFYKRYNALIKKIFKPLRKTSPTKYDPPKTTPKLTSSPTKTSYLPKSYLDDYYYPSQFYNPYWYRYSSYPYYRRYLHDYDYLPKVQPASVPVDVESIIRKSNIEDNYKPIKKNYIPTTYKYNPFESDSYLRSSLPTWKQYYYTQKLKSKPSNECYLDYYDPYYDFFPDAASVDSTDELSNEAPPLSHDANQLVDEYRDAIYEDIIQNLREKQSTRNKNTPLRADRKLFGYRVPDRAPGNYFSSEPYSYRPYAPTYRAAEYPNKYPTYSSYHDTPKPTYCKPEQNNGNRVKEDTGSEIPDIAKERNDFSQDYYKDKTDDSKIVPSDTQTRANVVSPSLFHTKCTTPVDNSFKYSGNLSPSKTKSWNVDGKLSPRTDDASPEKKLERYRSSNTLNKIKSPPYDENKRKYDTERIEYKPDRPIDEYKADSISQRRPDTFIGQYKPDTEEQYAEHTAIGRYKPDTSNQYGPSSIEYKTDTSPTRFAFSKENPEYPSFSAATQPSDKFTPLNSPTKAELRRSNYDEIPSNTFTPISSPTKPRSELRRPSNYSSDEFTKTLLPVSSDSDKYQRKNSLDKPRELKNETLPESRLQRLTSTSSFGAANREPDGGKYSDPVRRQTSPRRQTRLPTYDAGGSEDRAEPRRESSDSENLRRSSSARGRQLTPAERSTLSRRNSVVFDPKSSTSQAASRKNSMKPLQRRNSIQPEKRVLQKMNNEIKYDDEPPVSNESQEPYSIEEHEEVPFKSLTRFQKKLSKDEVFSGVDELAQRNMDSARGDRLAYQYDVSPEEPSLQKTSAPLPAKYYDENPSSYEENSKDSYGKDGYNAKEQFYPEYNEDTKYDSTKGSHTEQTYAGDTNSSLENYQKSYSQENGSNDQSGYYNQSAPSNVVEEYTSSQDQPRSGTFDSYGGQEHPSLVSQSSNDSRSRRSLQQSDENADASLSMGESPVRSHEPKEEQSLNSINEETEKADDKPKEIDSANVQPAESSAETAASKPKRSIDYGRSTIPRELSRRPSRSALLSQSSDDKKLKNQSSAGELQKRMSKPKIGESKLRRTTSTFKVRPTGPAKKT